MSDSDVDSKSSGVAKFGKPPDLCWSYYSTIPGPPDKDGNPTVQSANKRAHRKCSGCQEILKSCTVVTGIAHLKACGKAKQKHPGMLSALEGAAAARHDQLDVDLHYNIEAAFWMGEYVTLGEEEECQAFGDDPTAKDIDLDVLLAEAFN